MRIFRARRGGPSSRRRALALAVAVVILAGAAVLLLWRWMSPSSPEALEPDWAAIVSVIAGDGVAGMRDGDFSRARFSDPFGVSAAPDGSIYVADAGVAQRIRRIMPDGTVSTFAGSDQGFADGPASSARFSTPSGVAVGADGVVYVADTGNNAIRRITPDGTVSTFAGRIASGYQDGPARQARFNGPVGIAVDVSGRVIVADTYNDRIRSIARDGTVTTIAGSGDPGLADGPSAGARFDTPCGVAVDPAGTIYVADTGNGAVRAITPDGFVSTLEALAVHGLVRPMGVAVSDDGALYVTDDGGRTVEMTSDGRVRTLAGSAPGFADGAGVEARFRGVTGVAWTAPGRLVVADPRNALVRLVVARSRSALRPPPPPRSVPRFDVEAFARTPLLWPLAPMDGPFEITGTLGEPRGSEGERFHAGIDVHAPEGTLVRALRSGVVSSPVAVSEFGTLNESVRIGPLSYVHVRVGRERRGEAIDPARFVARYDDEGRVVHMRVRRGARFGTGEPIGTINPFDHVHLNVGWPGEEHNPLNFRLVNFEDTIPPVIARGGVRLFREDGQLLTQRKNGRLLVDGRIQVVVDAWDQVDGNEPRRRLGLYRLGYQVLDGDGSPAPGFETPRETLRFDRLAWHADAPRIVYATGSGIPFYGRRSTRFLYVVTSTLREGIATTGVWDATALPPGDYTLRILAADIHGNAAATNRDLPITKR